MGNFLLDALGDVGYALDTPGAYLRGALSGRAGERASGEELLSSYGVRGGPLGGLAAEMVVDPLTLLPPLYGAYKGVRALSGAADMAPLARRLGELGDATALDRRLGELGRQVDPLDRLRHDYRGTTGAGDPLSEAMGRFWEDELGAVRVPDFGGDNINAALKLHRDYRGNHFVPSGYSAELGDAAEAAYRKGPSWGFGAGGPPSAGAMAYDVDKLRGRIDDMMTTGQDRLLKGIIDVIDQGRTGFGASPQGGMRGLVDQGIWGLDEAEKAVVRDMLPGAFDDAYGALGGDLHDVVDVPPNLQRAVDRSAMELRGSDPVVAREFLGDEFTDMAVPTLLDDLARQLGGAGDATGRAMARDFLRLPDAQPRGFAGVEWLPQYRDLLHRAGRAAERYFGPSYYYLNNGLRTGGAIKPRYQDIANGLDELFAMSRVPSPIDLHRGVDGPGRAKIEQLLGADLASPEAIGRSYVDRGFLSTTYDPDVAQQFAGIASGYDRSEPGFVLNFGKVPAGSRASLMNASEKEVLWPPGRRITILDNSGFPNIRAQLGG